MFLRLYNMCKITVLFYQFFLL